MQKLKNIKAAKQEQLVKSKGTPIRLSADFSAKTLQTRREWHETFKMLKEKNLQSRILYLARLSFRFDRETKSFTDKK